VIAVQLAVKIIIFAVLGILLIPTVIVVGIAFGPAALVMLFVAGLALPVVLVVGWFERKPRVRLHR
jgi:hypothetical protein